jgi:hypothetical protein
LGPIDGVLVGVDLLRFKELSAWLYPPSVGVREASSSKDLFMGTLSEIVLAELEVD